MDHIKWYAKLVLYVGVIGFGGAGLIILLLGYAASYLLQKIMSPEMVTRVLTGNAGWLIVLPGLYWFIRCWMKAFREQPSMSTHRA
ncbi:MAG: hypothetical protein JWN50_266 [Parcubacteria group bacterium]|nr:hypothetical protein [Parcubacteria group bacterium]